MKRASLARAITLVFPRFHAMRSGKNKSESASGPATASDNADEDSLPAALAALASLADNTINLPLLIKQLKTRVGVVPFVGAGMSVPFGFPAWRPFLESQAPDDAARQQIRNLLDAGEYEEAAESLLRSRGADTFQTALADTFGTHRLPNPLPAAAILQLPRLCSGPVLTTNFDPVLERVFDSARRPFEDRILGMEVKVLRGAFDQSRPVLVKLHGDAADQSSRVLTRSDYERAYGDQEPLKPVLRFAMQARPLLFLGCSLGNDRTVRVLEALADELRQRKAGDLLAHYTVVEQPANDAEFATRHERLKQLGIFPIWYPTGQHQLLTDLLDYLAVAAQKEHLRQQRAKRTWVVAGAGIAIVLCCFAIAQRREAERQRENSHYEEGKAWLERSKYHERRNDSFAAQLMAARALGFAGNGREQQGPEFAGVYPPLLKHGMPEWIEATRVLSKCAGNGVPILQIIPSNQPQGDVQCVAFSPDGRLLASGGAEPAIKLWDAATGREVRGLVGHQTWVSTVAFSPNGNILASGAGDKTIKLWDVSSGRELRTMTGHLDALNSVVFSPDGKMLASGCREAFQGKDSTIKLWDVATGQELRTLSGHGSYVYSVAFSPDGQTLASGGDDHAVKMWDIASGRELRRVAFQQCNVRAVALSPDGAFLASNGEDNTIQLWDARNGHEVRRLTGHQDLVWYLTFSPNGKTLASASWDTTIKLWDVANGKELQTLTGHRAWANAASFSPDGQTLAAVGLDNRIKLWDVGSGRAAWTLTARAPDGAPEHVNSVAVSLNGQTLASGNGPFIDGEGAIRLFEMASGRELQKLRGHTNAVLSVATSGSENLVGSGSADGTIRIWNATTGQAIRTLIGHRGPVRAIAFSPNGSTLASGGEDQTVKLWDVAQGKEIRNLTKHTGAVRAVIFSADGRTLASGSSDSSIKLWDLGSGQELRAIASQQGTLLSVAFSADGKHLASSGVLPGNGENNVIKVWDLLTGQAVLTLLSRQLAVKAVTFSGDGRTLASAGADKTIKLWEIPSGRELRTLAGHELWVNTVAYSPNGMTLVSGSEDSTIKLWDTASSVTLAPYLIDGWVTLEGRNVRWLAGGTNDARRGAFRFLNVRSHSHLGILQSQRSDAKKTEALFWNYFHAQNWSSATLLYGELPDRARRESARGSLVEGLARSALEAQHLLRTNLARWRCQQVRALVGPNDTNTSVLKALGSLTAVEINSVLHDTSSHK